MNHLIKIYAVCKIQLFSSLVLKELTIFYKLIFILRISQTNFDHTAHVCRFIGIGKVRICLHTEILTFDSNIHRGEDFKCTGRLSREVTLTFSFLSPFFTRINS